MVTITLNSFILQLCLEEGVELKKTSCNGSVSSSPLSEKSIYIYSFAPGLLAYHLDPLFFLSSWSASIDLHIYIYMYAKYMTRERTRGERTRERERLLLSYSDSLPLNTQSLASFFILHSAYSIGNPMMNLLFSYP